MSTITYTFHYTYIIINTTNQMKYIGVRSCSCLPENDNDYMSSSKILIEELQKNPEAFTKTIIDTFPTREIANANEQWLHETYDVARNSMFYNQMNAPLGFCQTGKTRKVSEEIRKKMSEAQKGKKLSEETRKKLSIAHRGKIISSETSAKISYANMGEKNGMYGKNHSEETKKKISANRSSISGKNNPMYGKKHSEEAKKKMSAAKKGKKKPPFTEEHRRNLSLAWKRRNLSIPKES